MQLTINLLPTRAMLANHNLETGGKVQQYIDSRCIKFMKPYTPFRTGVLQGSATRNTVIGSGLIQQKTPYARYLYYGVVYGPNFPIFSGGDVVGFYSPPHKYPTGRQLNYDTSRHGHELAGKMWFERMKADHKGEILKGAMKIAR